MIQSASKYPVSDIFNIDTQVKYVIPKYQREYIWSKDNWEKLFNDLMDNDKGHFLGSIICIDKGKDVLDCIPLEVVDGQQRITTISLLYLALYEKLKNEDRKDDDSITERSNLKNRVIQKSRKNELKLELSYQNNNFQDYKAILADLGLYNDNYFIKSKYFGNRQISKAFKFFEKKIVDFDYEETIDLISRINSAWIVKIEVSNDSDAFILFETLNNTGEPLKAIDLIKNKILSELEKKRNTSIDEAFDRWVKVANNLPDYINQERFLRHYYNAFRYKNKIKVENYSRASKSNIIKIYEKIIQKDVEFIMDELIEKSNMYNIFIEPKKYNTPYKDGLIDLLNIGSAPSYAFLLYLFCEHSHNSKLIQQSINLLVKYFVRRNLTDYPGTRDLDNIFLDLIDLCEKNSSELSFSIINEYLINETRFADKDSFIKKLYGSIYEENNPVARFILCKLEEQYKTKETLSNLWERNEKGTFVWSMEHIFPEGENLTDYWINSIGDGDREKTRLLQEKYVHKIGNLTLSRYNSNLSNSSFIEKRDKIDDKGNYIGYKNGLYLNRDLVDKEIWKINDIEIRTEKLVNEIMGIFDT